MNDSNPTNTNVKVKNKNQQLNNTSKSYSSLMINPKKATNSVSASDINEFQDRTDRYGFIQ